MLDTKKKLGKRKDVPASLTLALKYIAACLRHVEEYGNQAYAAYRLRRIRYNLLRNNGYSANLTYPRINHEITAFNHIRPVQIRYMNRMSGAGNRGASGELVAGMRFVSA
jgi:hypothetical protein